MSFLRHLLPAWRTNIEKKSRANEAILSALDRELTEAEQDAIKGKVEMNLETATGKWLDQYGDLFGLNRRDGESDTDFRRRIVKYVQLERGTIPAIIEAIRDYLQDYESHIEIYEPYTNIFTLNRSRLNGEDHMLGEYYSFAIIDVKFARTFPAEVIDIINEFKPAGVKVWLTYRPGAYNPNAPIIDVPLADSEVYPTGVNLTIMNGMHNIVNGHLSLAERVRDERDDSDIFILNRSKLNSLDRLIGSFASTRPNYNLATYSEADLKFTTDTTIADVLTATSEMSPDFYTQTKRKDDLFAEHTVNTNKLFMYLTLDLATYLETNFSPHLNDAEPSGNFTRDTYLYLAEQAKLQYAMKATTSPRNPVQFDLQLLNLDTDEWVTVDSGQMRFSLESANVPIEDLSPFLSNSGLVFTRLQLQEGDDMYNVHLHFYELGFYKDLGVKPIINVPFYTDIIGMGTEGGRAYHTIQNREYDLNDRPHTGSPESMSFFLQMSPEDVDTQSSEHLRIVSNTIVTETD